MSLATRTSLGAGLASIGLRAGHIVMVHASIRSLGSVLGGVNTVVEALFDAITPSGTLLAYVDWEIGADESQLRDPRLRDELPVFDKRTAKANRSHGILAETIRTWPGAIRSDHPDAGVAAIGPLAAELCADHPRLHGYGARSPFDKLVVAGGHVLLLGAPFETLTLLHHAEHIARIPGKRTVRYERPVRTGDRHDWVSFEEFDTGDPVTDELLALYPDYFTRIARRCLETGGGRSGHVGEAQCYYFDAASLVATGVAWLEGDRA